MPESSICPFHKQSAPQGQLASAYRNCTKATTRAEQGDRLGGNTASDNGGHGFSLELSNGNGLVNNTADGQRSGYFLLSSSGNNLSGNVAKSNADGFVLDLSTGNSLSGNTASRNLLDGFRLLDSGDNSLVANSARQNGNYGFFVDLLSIDNFFADNGCFKNGLGGDNRSDLDIC
jgi:parallel beta-helix repeat protein